MGHCRNHRPKADGITVMCLRGCETSVPPAWCTNSAGENVLPWQTQTMLISDFEYLYRNPWIVFPFGPFPVVDTYGIWVLSVFWVWGLGGSILLSFNGVGAEASLDEMGLEIGTGSVISGAGSSLGWTNFWLPWEWDSIEGEVAEWSDWDLVSLAIEPFKRLEWLIVSLLAPPEYFKKPQNQNQF